MASMSKRNGRYVLQFVGADKRRRTIHLGDVSKRDAQTVKSHVETIVSAAIAGQQPPDDTSRWVARLPDALHDKLAKVGLVQERERATLAAFIDGYIAGRTDLKPSTLRHLREAGKSMAEFFGAETALRDITPGDADDFRRWLARSLGPNTVARRCGRVKQFLRAAVRKRLLAESPFADMKGCAVKANKEREYFVTRDEADKVLTACPDSEWRLIFALSRYGGLRCPSEHLALTWADINWEANRMTVRSPKTEHHEGQESRQVPVFPELKPYLEAAFDEAPEGTVHVITRYRDAGVNLRTQLLRIIAKAGLNPWPKLFQNLRATRATELTADYPGHVAAAWLGHSTAIAQKHYWQVTDIDFDKATAAESTNEKALQNALHKPPVTGCKPLQTENGQTTEGIPLQPVAEDCSLMNSCSVPPHGLEP